MRKMTKQILYFFSILTLFGSLSTVMGQMPDVDMRGIDVDDDLQVGGDIFSDFNEDLSESKILEDERFYRYGRFFSFNMGLGLTTFDGNRGAAYENDHPTYALSLNYFQNFNSSFGLGFEYSKHHFFLDHEVKGHQDNGGEPVGLIEVNMLRFFFGYRYYVDTSNLGTAITYSNPYLTGRFEYWYMTKKLVDLKRDEAESGGGVGFGLGGGFEFPIILKESYINTEFLFHTVNFKDKYTQLYRPVDGSNYGYDDMTGYVYSMVVNYVISW